MLWFQMECFENINGRRNREEERKRQTTGGCNLSGSRPAQVVERGWKKDGKKKRKRGNDDDEDDSLGTNQSVSRGRNEGQYANVVS